MKVIDGTCFVLPLESGGFARGVIARRSSRSKVVLAYFFGPRLNVAGDGAVDESLRLGNEILVELCSCMSLENGRWPQIGVIQPFVASEWPIPLFRIADSPSGPRANRYNSKDLLNVEEVVHGAEAARAVYPDGLGGATSPEWSVDKAFRRKGI